MRRIVAKLLRCGALPSPNKPRILVTGGTPECSASFCARLTGLGYAVTTVLEDGFDVALMDCREDVDRAVLGCGHPVIGVIDHGTAIDLRRLLSAGIDGFVGPAFGGAELAAVLAEIETGRRETGEEIAKIAAGGSAATILLIEDDALMRTIVGSIVKKLGHECREAGTGRDGLTLALTESPQLIVLDRALPDTDGLEVLAELRAHLMTSSIPVILLTSHGRETDRVAGLRAGADDYIVKPFKPAELAARLEATLRRSRRDLAADPLTKLPGNAALRQELATRVRSQQPVAVVYADLNEFKAYVDFYGFERASLAIQRVAQMLYNMLVEIGEPDDFLGHIGGDDFLLLLPPDRAEVVCGRVLEAFCNLAPMLYDEQDRARGYIEGHDRYGVERRFHLMSMVFAIIEIPPGADTDLEEVGGFAASCKKTLKLQGGNSMAHFRFDGAAT